MKLRRLLESVFCSKQEITPQYTGTEYPIRIHISKMERICVLGEGKYIFQIRRGSTWYGVDSEGYEWPDYKYQIKYCICSTEQAAREFYKKYREEVKNRECLKGD